MTISIFFFFDLYGTAFLKREIETKTQFLQSSWITRDLQKSSKQKKRLYEKFLKKEQLKIKLCIRSIKVLSKIKEKLKREVHVTLFPKKLIIKKIEITDMKAIAETFNFFVIIWPNLLSKIPQK